MTQKHRDAGNRTNRIRDSPPGDVRSGAVNRLIESGRRVPAVALDARAERRRGQKPNRSGEHGCLVGEDIAEHVFGDDHVERCRALQQMHRARVDEQMLEHERREFLRNHSHGHLPPQPRRLQDVRLVDRCELAATFERETSRNAHDAFDLHRRVRAFIDRALAVRTERRARLLAEVDAARQLANHDEVHPGEFLSLERRRGRELRVHRHRTHVGEQSERLANAEQPLFWTNRGARIVPRGAAHSAEEHCIARATDGDRRIGKRITRGVDRRAADQRRCHLEGVPPPCGHRLQHTNALGNDLGADAIARQQRDPCTHSVHSRARALVRGDLGRLRREISELVDALQHAVARKGIDGKVEALAAGQGERLALEIDREY